MPSYGYLLNLPSVQDTIEGIVFTRGTLVVYPEDQPKLNAYVPDRLDRFVDGLLDNSPTLTDEPEYCKFLGAYNTQEELIAERPPTANTGSVALVNKVLYYSNGESWVTFTGSGGLGSGTNLSQVIDATGITIRSDTGTDITLPLANGTLAGLMPPASVTKLSTIEPNATADMTPAEIVSAINFQLSGSQWQTAGATSFAQLEDATSANIAGTNASIVNALQGKQATLISGSTIKTVNGENILGSGNITIASGNSNAYQEVLNFAALPASPAEGVTYIVLQSSGVFFVNRRPAGLYRYTSGNWVYLGEVPDGYFTDSIATFYDDADISKKARFELSGISTGTTRTLIVPDASGTIALTNDPRFTDSRNPLTHTHQFSDLPNTIETITGSQSKADAAQSTAVALASADASAKASGRIPIGQFINQNADKVLAVEDNNNVFDTGATSRQFNVNSGLATSFVGITVEGPCTWVAGSGVTLLEDRPTGTGQNFCQLIRVGTNKYRVYGERA